MSRAALVLLAASAAGLVAGEARPAPPAKPAATGTTQDVIFFTPDGPVRVRVAVTIAGRPALAAWSPAADAVFGYADRNGDGNLSQQERQNLQFNRGVVAEGLVINELDLRSGPVASGIVFPEQNGKVSRDAFRMGLILSGFGPVTANPFRPRSDSAALTDALFKHLDTDGDGKLSAPELRAARARLAPLDADEDELLSVDELLDRGPQQPVYQAIEVNVPPEGPRPKLQLPDVLVGPAGYPLTARVVLDDRDRDKNGALTTAELGCSPAAFAALDANGDGKLNTAELTAWLGRPPEVDLAADLADPWTGGSWLPFPRRPGAWNPPRPLAAAGGTLASRLTTGPDGALRLNLTRVRFRFAADQATGSAARQQSRTSLAAFRTAFAKASKGKGTVAALTVEQLTENPDFAPVLQMFSFADRNGDGKLTQAEVTRAVATAERLVNCRAEVAVSDQGRGLFELLDTDGDGRLSTRELAAAGDLVAALDRDGDGKLSRDEIPRGYAVTVRAASLQPFQGVSDFDVGDLSVLADGRVAAPARKGTPDAPEWFKKADRNGDGDVSAKEFPGPPALFKRIDADGDGLISPAEARAFERTTAAAK